MKVTWLGHATVLFETEHGRFITDPVLRRRIVHLKRHAPPVETPQDIDAVLLSHVHHDHLDLPSLRAVGRDVYGPPGAGKLLRRAQLPFHELAAGSDVELAGARITAVDAVHDGRRWPTGDPRDDDSIGFIVEEAGTRVYFAGDTELFDGMRELGELDLALVPIWGWGPSLGPGHMNPDEAATALEMIRPRVAVPIHWGTFLPIGLHRSHGRLLRDPADDFRRHAAERTPDVRVEVLQPGGSLVIPDPTSRR